jgi:hypothetical protein
VQVRFVAIIEISPTDDVAKFVFDYTNSAKGNLGPSKKAAAQNIRQGERQHK